MNDEKNNSTSFANKILNIFKKKKNTFLSILIILILALISINILKIYKDDKNKKIAGTLGIDINAHHYIERLAPIKIAALRAAVGSFVISFFFGLAVWFLRNFSKQMNASRQEISKDFAAFSKKEGKDE